MCCLFIFLPYYLLVHKEGGADKNSWDVLLLLILCAKGRDAVGGREGLAKAQRRSKVSTSICTRSPTDERIQTYLHR